MLERPELYLNGEYKDKKLAQYAIIDFLHKFGPYFPKALSTLDKEAMDYLLRQRIRTFSKSAIKLSTLNKDEINLIKNFQNSLNLDGKPFFAKQKAEIFDLLLAYKENNIPLDNIEINSDVKLSDSAQIKLRNAIIDYTKNIAKRVTNSQEIDIVIGTMNNDLNTMYLAKESNNVKFVGEVNENKIYLDAFTSHWKRDDEVYSRIYYNITS